VTGPAAGRLQCRAAFRQEETNATS
jgi:hypothetical protein